MQADAIRTIGQKFFEAQDRLRGGPDRDLCSTNYLARIGSNAPMTLADHEGFAQGFYAAFPDLRHMVEEVVAEDQRVAVRFTMRGTHRGDFMGIPATGKSIEVGAIAILYVADGKVLELRGQFDQLGMMRQLGVIP